MADFTASGAETSGFTDAEGREVVMEHKPPRCFRKKAVEHLFVELCAECQRRQRLCFAPREERRTMCPRQHADFAGNRTNVRQYAAVEALLLSQDHFPHLDFFEIVQNLSDGFFLFGIFFRKRVCRFFDDGSIGIRTRFFRKNGVDRRFDLFSG